MSCRERFCFGGHTKPMEQMEDTTALAWWGFHPHVPCEVTEQAVHVMGDQICFPE